MLLTLCKSKQKSLASSHAVVACFHEANLLLVERLHFEFLEIFVGIRCRPDVGVVIKDIAISTRGLKFDSRAAEIGHSVANGSSLAAMFLRSCVAQALSPGGGPRHSLHSLAYYRGYNKDFILFLAASNFYPVYIHLAKKRCYREKFYL